MIHLYAIGSPIEQDNLAWILVEKLQPQLTAQFPELYIEYFDRPGMQLVNEMAGKQGVILVDTLLADNLHIIQSLQTADLQQLSINLSSHGFGVAEALQLSQQLNLLPETLWIFGIPTTPDSNTGTPKTQRLCKQLEQYIENILKLPDLDTTQ